jgi:hypothetical protein
MNALKNNLFIQIIFSVFIVIALLFKYFFYIDEMIFSYNLNQAPLLSFLNNIVGSNVSRIILSVIVVVFSSMLINFGIYKDFIEKKYKNYYSLFFSLILLVSFIQVDNFYAPLIANFFFMVAMAVLTIAIYKKHNSYNCFFNSAFSISLATLFYPGAVYLFVSLLLFIPFTNNKNIFKILFLYLLGAFMPYYLLFSYLYLIGETGVLVNMFNSYSLIGFDLSLANSYFYLIVIGILTIISILSIIMRKGFWPIETKNFYSYFTILFLLMLVLVIFVLRRTEAVIFALTLLPILFSQLFSSITRAKTFLIFMIILSILYLQFPDAINFV